MTAFGLGMSELSSVFPNLTSDASLFVSNPNSLDIEALLSHLTKTEAVRNKIPLTSLMRSSTRTIVENMHRFLTYDTVLQGHKYNPFAHLPNSIVQYFIQESKFWDHPTSDSILFCFLLQIISPFTTEYTTPRFKFLSDATRTSESVVFRHLLQYCPKIQKIEVSKLVWEDLVVVPRVFEVDIFRLMSLQWPNLTFLNVNFGYPTKEQNADTLLDMISSYLPTLNDLEICLAMETLSKKGVNHFSQRMQKLKYLGVYLNNGVDTNSLILLVHAVGKLPSINKFAILSAARDETDTACVRFVDEYGQRYPQKELTLVNMQLCRLNLKHSWPECLAVEKLTIMKEIDHSEKKNCGNFWNFLTGNCSPKNLVVRGGTVNHLYALVEKFGPLGLTDLEVYLSDETPLDAFRVLAACPKLQNIDIVSRNFADYSDFEVLPRQFEHCENFQMAVNNPEETEYPEISSRTELYKKFLVGSKKYIKKLSVNFKSSLSDLNAIFWTLTQERRTCLDQVEEICIHTLNYQAKDDAENKAYKIALMLAMRSPNLKKVDLRGSFDYSGPPNWYSDLFYQLKIALVVRSRVINGISVEVGYVDFDSLAEEESMDASSDPDYYDGSLFENFW